MPKDESMRLELRVGSRVVAATLLDNQASRELIGMLPQTLTLSDHASTEKVSDLPSGLTTTDSPAGYAPSAGDIAYYAPWGNLALFYRDFNYSGGLVKLGTIDSGLDILAGQNDDFTATLQLARKP